MDRYKNLYYTDNQGRPMVNYDVVYLGQVISLNYSNYSTRLYELLASRYVLIFETSQKEVTMYLEQDYKVSYFGSLLNGNTKFHLITDLDFPYKVNESVTLVKNNNNSSFEIIAQVNQGPDIFILKSFNDGYNKDHLILSDDLRFKIKVDSHTEEIDRIKNLIFGLSMYKTEYKNEKLEAIELVLELLEGKEKEKRMAFKNYEFIAKKGY